MVLTGTIVNAWFIIFGSMIGIFLQIYQNR